MAERANDLLRSDSRRATVALPAEAEAVAEQAETDAIVRGFLALQARAAAAQRRPLGRGTHPKGVCVRAVFELLDVRAGRDAALAARLAVGIYAVPGRYPAIVRFANSAPYANADCVPDVRGASFAVELSRSAGSPARQDYSLQSAPTLPFNEPRAFAVYAQVVNARSEAIAIASLPFRDQLTFAQTRVRVLQQQRQAVRPYQQLRYWSNVPFRHGPDDVVKYSLTPAAGNPANALDRRNPNALRDELLRHVSEDPVMSTFDFGLQFLDIMTMTHQGTRRDAAFWIENAAVEWPEQQAPFHTVARLTLLPHSGLSAAACDAMYIDVTGNSSASSAPVGRINRARWHAETASRKARQSVP
jgi:hypothetical protein